MNSEKNLAQSMEDLQNKRNLLKAKQDQADKLNVSGTLATNGIIYDKPEPELSLPNLADLKTLSELLFGLQEIGKAPEPEARVFEENNQSYVNYDDSDLEDKTFIVRIQVKDNITGQKSEKGKITFSKVDGTIRMDADAGMTEVHTPVDTAHGIFFTQMIQAVREFIEDDLDGDN